ncbi:MAG: putative rane protein [Herbinix sp.]|nr:putative rane protein [Herbinix sp.]
MKKQSKNGYTKVGWLFFYLYIILLFYFLFFSERYGRDSISENYRYNLEFLKEIKRFIKYRERIGFESFVVNIMGNILAFAPFGFMLPLLNNKLRSFFKIAFLSIFFSLMVECLQLAFRVGIFDVDDIFLNSIGGIIGYLFFAIGNGVICIFRKRKQKRRGT